MKGSGLDPNEDVCGACGLGGELICCESCPAAFHIACAGYSSLEDVPSGDWLCWHCAQKVRRKFNSLKTFIPDSGGPVMLASDSQLEVFYRTEIVQDLGRSLVLKYVDLWQASQETVCKDDVRLWHGTTDESCWTYVGDDAYRPNSRLYAVDMARLQAMHRQSKRERESQQQSKLLGRKQQPTGREQKSSDSRVKLSVKSLTSVDGSRRSHSVLGKTRPAGEAPRNLQSATEGFKKLKTGAVAVGKLKTGAEAVEKVPTSKEAGRKLASNEVQKSQRMVLSSAQGVQRSAGGNAKDSCQLFPAAKARMQQQTVVHVTPHNGVDAKKTLGPENTRTQCGVVRSSNSSSSARPSLMKKPTTVKGASTPNEAKPKGIETGRENIRQLQKSSASAAVTAATGGDGRPRLGQVRLGQNGNGAVQQQRCGDGVQGGPLQRRPVPTGVDPGVARVASVKPSQPAFAAVKPSQPAVAAVKPPRLPAATCSRGHSSDSETSTRDRLTGRWAVPGDTENGAGVDKPNRHERVREKRPSEQCVDKPDRQERVREKRPSEECEAVCGSSSLPRGPGKRPRVGAAQVQGGVPTCDATQQSRPGVATAKGGVSRNGSDVKAEGPAGPAFEDDDLLGLGPSHRASQGYKTEVKKNGRTEPKSQHNTASQPRVGRHTTDSKPADVGAATKESDKRATLPWDKKSGLARSGSVLTNDGDEISLAGLGWETSNPTPDQLLPILSSFPVPSDLPLDLEDFDVDDILNEFGNDNSFEPTPHINGTPSEPTPHLNSSPFEVMPQHASPFTHPHTSLYTSFQQPMLPKSPIQLLQEAPSIPAPFDVTAFIQELLMKPAADNLTHLHSSSDTATHHDGTHGPSCAPSDSLRNAGPCDSQAPCCTGLKCSQSGHQQPPCAHACGQWCHGDHGTRCVCPWNANEREEVPEGSCGSCGTHGAVARATPACSTSTQASDCSKTGPRCTAGGCSSNTSSPSYESPACPRHCPMGASDDTCCRAEKGRSGSGRKQEEAHQCRPTQQYRDVAGGVAAGVARGGDHGGGVRGTQREDEDDVEVKHKVCRAGGESTGGSMHCGASDAGKEGSVGPGMTDRDVGEDSARSAETMAEQLGTAAGLNLNLNAGTKDEKPSSKPSLKLKLVISRGEVKAVKSDCGRQAGSSCGGETRLDSSTPGAVGRGVVNDSLNKSLEDQRETMKPDSSGKDSVQRECMKSDDSRQDSVQRESMKSDSSRKESVQRETRKPDSSLQDSVQRESMKSDDSHRSLLTRKNDKTDSSKKDSAEREDSVIVKSDSEMKAGGVPSRKGENTQGGRNGSNSSSLTNVISGREGNQQPTSQPSRDLTRPNPNVASGHVGNQQPTVQPSRDLTRPTPKPSSNDSRPAAHSKVTNRTADTNAPLLPSLPGRPASDAQGRTTEKLSHKVQKPSAIPPAKAVVSAAGLEDDDDFANMVREREIASTMAKAVSKVPELSAGRPPRPTLGPVDQAAPKKRTAILLDPVTAAQDAKRLKLDPVFNPTITAKQGKSRGNGHGTGPLQLKQKGEGRGAWTASHPTANKPLKAGREGVKTGVVQQGVTRPAGLPPRSTPQVGPVATASSGVVLARPSGLMPSAGRVSSAAGRVSSCGQSSALSASLQMKSGQAARPVNSQKPSVAAHSSPAVPGGSGKDQGKGFAGASPGMSRRLKAASNASGTAGQQTTHAHPRTLTAHVRRNQ